MWWRWRGGVVCHALWHVSNNNDDNDNDIDLCAACETACGGGGGVGMSIVSNNNDDNDMILTCVQPARLHVVEVEGWGCQLSATTTMIMI